MAWLALLIPILGILCGIICGSLAIWTDHKQKMAMIEKGIKPEELHPRRPEDILIAGLVVIGIGIAFLLVHFWIGLTRWLTLPGFILLFIGIALTTSYYLTREKVKRRKDEQGRISGSNK